jgi:SAM-dependent methyltransferase
VVGNPAGPFGQKILGRSEHKVRRAVELGLGLGRALAELSRGAEYVVGLDYNIGFLRRVRRLLAGEPVPYLRRMAGWWFEEAVAKAGDLASPWTLLVCADALNPPLEPGAYGRVVAGNLVDKVSSPQELFSAMDELCQPGGEVILTTPIAWSSASTLDDQRIGRHDPGKDITARWRDGWGLSAPYTIEDDADIAWWLRGDSRVGYSYRNYFLRARKPG